MLFASAGIANTSGPILTKVNTSGLMDPDRMRPESCHLFHNKVVIRRLFGQGQPLLELRPIKIGEHIHELVEQARLENLVIKPNRLCDSPSTTIQAFHFDDQDSALEVPLFRTGGCGVPALNRMGPRSQALRDMIGHYCATTHLPPE